MMDRQHRYTLLLTACINPGGMIMTHLTDASIRQKQYVEALSFYLTHTSLPIVFVENSSTDISPLFQEHIQSGRLECFTFTGNQFNKEKGKGYGEVEIMEYALLHSKLLGSSHYVVKITGRLIISNIHQLVNVNQRLSHPNIQTSLNSDYTFADSRLFIASPYFITHHFFPRKEGINDSQGRYFEHILCESIKEQADFYCYSFLLTPVFKGTSGSTGSVYDDSASFYDQMQKLRFNIQNTLLFNQRYAHKQLPSLQTMLLKLIRWGVTAYVKLT